MKIYFTNGKIIYPDKIESGFVTVCGQIIEQIGKGSPQVEETDIVYDLDGRYLSPGFVEIHSHGAGGSDFMDGTPEAVITAAKTHLKHGTTTLFPTTLAASREKFWEVLMHCAQHVTLCQMVLKCRDSIWKDLT